MGQFNIRVGRYWPNELVHSVHESLLDSYGAERESSWEPSLENVVIVPDIEFERIIIDLKRYDDRRVADAIARDTTGYAFTEEGVILIREGEVSNPSSFNITLAHEELHVWCKRNRIDPDEYSYYVNEQFIDYLALRALGLMDKPLCEIPEHQQDRIVNSMYLHEILDPLGDEGGRLLFRVCQGDSQDTLRERLNEFYGEGPVLNSNVRTQYGIDFYGRFKDFALFIYLVGHNPQMQYTPGARVFGDLMLTWISAKKEIKHLSRGERD